ncbi:hypothetical protein NQ314_006904 [Rhamnusium bicolor]|uniref:Uncharacterized protein n=1 Tax=Rhamnusium bicolor TaxID=1586634 RepID=A0AAV8YWC1_9CUCU|nr:hypothetical protein NQ314_006904 [Rhamnusium bicolor]
MFEDARTVIPYGHCFMKNRPKNYAPVLFKETQNLFNITSTFSRHSNFPLTLQYLTDLSLIKGKNMYFNLCI